MDDFESYSRVDQLWPTLQTLSTHWDVNDGGYLPKMPAANQPTWNLLDKEWEWGIWQQLSTLLDGLGSRIPDEIRHTVSIDESQGVVHIAERVLIEPGVHIEGPAYIGPESQLRQGAYIRAGTWVCYQAVVGHVTEVKHSLLLPMAKAPHFNYVGDSVLGSYVNIGAGCKLSNLRWDGAEVVMRCGAEHRGSGLRKFGALLGDRAQLGCNCVTNPGTVLGPNSFVHPNVTVTGVFPEKALIKK